MKSMQDYTIYCTEEQTKKALELGAPIITSNSPFMVCYILDNSNYAVIPTAEQMIGWLEEQGFRFTIQSKNEDITFGFCVRDSKLTEIIDVKGGFHSRKVATLAAIDTALEYLINNKQQL